MKRFCFSLIICFYSTSVFSIESIQLEFAELIGESWSLKRVQTRLSKLSDGQQRLELVVKKLNLPSPLNNLKGIYIQCKILELSQSSLTCQRGHAKLSSDQSTYSNIKFSFELTQRTGSSKLSGPDSFAETTNAGFGNGPTVWRASIVAENLQMDWIHSTFPQLPVSKLDGRVDINMKIAGVGARFDQINLEVSGSQIAMEVPDGKLATDGLVFKTNFQGKTQTVGQWEIEADFDLMSGGMYVEPIFVDLEKGPLGSNVKLVWNTHENCLSVDKIALSHRGVFDLEGDGVFLLGNPPDIKQMELDFSSTQIGTFFSTYVSPKMDNSITDGISLEGQIKAAVGIEEGTMSHIDIQVADLDLNEQEGRFEVRGGRGGVEWSRDLAEGPLNIAWRSAQVHAIDLGQSQLSFITDLTDIRLVDDVDIPVFDGIIHIEEFEVLTLSDTEKRVKFNGFLGPLSLKEISNAFSWPPLSGTVSGVIPSVSYQSGELSIGGKIKIHAFDGDLSIDALTVSDLLGELPRLTANIEFNDLDLFALSKRFSFGTIQGRLEGSIDRLYLEDWKPISFDAWFGTPKSDRSTHRISQKAVENITSLGGGATDVLSRSFLRFFDSFSYDRIGIGCRLHDGICELRGVEQAPNGYYIVKGNSVPQINVIGYNRQVDWSALLERLKRIGVSDRAQFE